MVDGLRSWALSYNIKQTAIDGLLKLLRNVIPDSKLPGTAKTLLKTPTSKVAITKMSNGGEYWHFGVKLILDILSVSEHELPNNVNLNINIDGINVEKSGTKAFWPILCSIEGMDLYPMVVGIYSGNEKPGKVKDYTTADEFLKQFVAEMVDFEKQGYRYNDKTYSVNIHKLINDVPANALVKKTKGHTGTHACGKCDTRGTSLQRSSVTCFPDYGDPRTNNSFRNKVQAEHHHGTSLLTNIKNLDMVKQFPIDYMHLICLGNVKKEISFWTNCPTDNKAGKLSANQEQVINQRLVQNADIFPSDFNRKLRDFYGASKWKATQCRSFLLYVRVVVLKGILDERIYNNFLLLHVGTTICISEDHLQHIDLAEMLFFKYVENFTRIYGEKYVAQNVHNMGHITDDVRTFGVLDNFSAFKYENKLGMLKKLIRSGYLPLQQVAKRIYEMFFYDIQKQGDSNNNIEESETSLNFRNSIIKNNEKDGWFMSKDTKDIFAFISKKHKNNEIYIVGRKIKDKKDFYEKPIRSR